MRPRLTWTVSRWSYPKWGDRRKEIRNLFDADASEELEAIAVMARDRRDRPSAQDVKRTLAAIARAPEHADLRRLDALCKAALEAIAWQRYRATKLGQLRSDELAVCASHAALSTRRKAGRLQTDDLALQVLRIVEHAFPTADSGTRDNALAAALRGVGLAYSQKTIERLRAKAARTGQIF